MQLLLTVLISAIRIVAFVYDLFTYIPYYFIQEPKRVLELSNRHKSVRVEKHTTRPLRCVEEVDLVSTPDERCTTLDDLFRKAVDQYQNMPALGRRERVLEQEVRTADTTTKTMQLGEYIWSTYSDIERMVSWFGSGLIDLGLEAQKRIIIFAETRPEWLIAAQACFREEIILVTLYATASDADIVYVAEQTEVTTIITSQELLPNLLRLLPTLNHVTTIVTLEDYTIDPKDVQFHEINERVVKVISYEETIKRGRILERSESDPERVMSQQMAVIMYGSGGVDKPKGVMLTHSNILSSCAGFMSRMHIGAGDTYVAHLPLAHILELVAEICCMFLGIRIGYSNISTLIDGAPGLAKGCRSDVSILKPTVMMSTPAVLERISCDLQKFVNNNHKIIKKIYEFSIAYKRKWLYHGSNTPILNAIIMRKFRKILGGNLQKILSGMGPLNPETQEYLRLTLCCPVLQSYSLSEAGVCAISDLDDLNAGSVGGPLPCNFINVIDWERESCVTLNSPNSRGEVWVGGTNVALGYYNEPERTEEEFQQRAYIRWFATRDMASLRFDSSLAIFGRKDNLITLETGEYISPTKIESVLQSCPFVDVLCVTTNQHLIVCIIVPHMENLKAIADELAEPTEDWLAVCNSEKVKNEVLEQLQVQATKFELNPQEMPQAVAIVHKELLPDLKLMTSTIGTKRRQLQEYYAQTMASVS